MKDSHGRVSYEYSIVGLVEYPDLRVTVLAMSVGTATAVEDVEACVVVISVCVRKIFDAV